MMYLLVNLTGAHTYCTCFFLSLRGHAPRLEFQSQAAAKRERKLTWQLTTSLSQTANDQEGHCRVEQHAEPIGGCYLNR